MEIGVLEKRLEGLLEAFIFEDRILLTLKRGVDITDELEQGLEEYGIELHREFKSPCG